MGHLSPKYIVIYHKGSDPPKFSTLEKRTKEDTWGDTWKIQILGQGEIPESGEHLLTPTEIPSQIPTKLEEVGKYVVGDNLTREDMVRTWLTKDPLGRDDRDLLVWNHRLNHCSFKYLLRLSKRGAIPRNILDIRKFPPCVACLFGKCHKRPWSTKGKLSGG